MPEKDRYEYLSLSSAPQPALLQKRIQLNLDLLPVKQQIGSLGGRRFDGSESMHARGSMLLLHD